MFGFVGSPLLARPAQSALRPARTSQRPSILRCAATAAAASTHELDGSTISGPLEPAGHNILVKVAKAAEKTIGGLILSTEAKDAPTYGAAVAVGPGRYFPAGGIIPMAVKTGDVVMFGKFGGTKVKYDGEAHLIVTQDDVLCLLDGGVNAASAVRPVHDRILVKVDKPADELESGILLAGGGADKPTTGTVAKIGTGRVMENGEIEPMPVAAGDKVLYGQYAGTDVMFDGEPYIFVRVVDIFARWAA
jgi:chaperonin GroES